VATACSSRCFADGPEGREAETLRADLEAAGVDREVLLPDQRSVAIHLAARVGDPRLIAVPSAALPLLGRPG